MRLVSFRFLALNSALVVAIFLSPELVAQSETAAPVAGAAQPGTTAEHPVRIASRVMAAQVIKHPEPASPTGASAGVVLKVLIDPTGKVLRSTAMSGPAELKDAASRTVNRWTYKPYLLNGTPVFVETSVMVEFKP